VKAVNQLSWDAVILVAMAPQSNNLLHLLTVAPTAFAPGDVGAVPRIKSLSALKTEVERHFGNLPTKDIDALVGWFNQNFFRFKD
jgi:hypothetical protein